MDAKHFLQRAKTSFQTFIALTHETELTQEVLRLLRDIESGKEEYFMLCEVCQEVSCECDHNSDENPLKTNSKAYYEK